MHLAPATKQENTDQPKKHSCNGQYFINHNFNQIPLLKRAYNGGNEVPQEAAVFKKSVEGVSFPKTYCNKFGHKIYVMINKQINNRRYKPNKYHKFLFIQAPSCKNKKK